MAPASLAAVLVAARGVLAAAEPLPTASWVLASLGTQAALAQYGDAAFAGTVTLPPAAAAALGLPAGSVSACEALRTALSFTADAVTNLTLSQFAGLTHHQLGAFDGLVPPANAEAPLNLQVRACGYDAVHCPCRSPHALRRPGNIFKVLMQPGGGSAVCSCACKVRAAKGRWLSVKQLCVCLQGAQIVDQSAAIVDAQPALPACFNAAAFESVRETAGNWSFAGASEVARVATSEFKAARTPVAIDDDVRALLWAVFGPEWDIRASVKRGVCVRSRSLPVDCTPSVGQLERIGQITGALALGGLLNRTDTLSVYQAATLLPVFAAAELGGAEDAAADVADRLESEAAAAGPLGRAAALRALATTRDAPPALAAAVATDLAAAGRASYSAALSALALATFDGGIGSAAAPATVVTAGASPSVLFTAAGDVDAASAPTAAGDVVAAATSGEGVAGVAVRAMYYAPAPAEPQDNGLSVATAFRQYNASAGTGVGPLLSEAALMDTLVVTVQVRMNPPVQRLVRTRARSSVTHALLADYDVPAARRRCRRRPPPRGPGAGKPHLPHRCQRHRPAARDALRRRRLCLCRPRARRRRPVLPPPLVPPPPRAPTVVHRRRVRHHPRLLQLRVSRQRVRRGVRLRGHRPRRGPRGTSACRRLRP